MDPTIVLSPAAKVLIKVEGGSAMPHLDIREPLRHDVQEGRIQANGCADDCNDNPALRRIVRFPKAIFPAWLAVLVHARGSFPAGLSSGLFPCGILYPVCAAIYVSASLSAICARACAAAPPLSLGLVIEGRHLTYRCKVLEAQLVSLPKLRGERVGGRKAALPRIF